MERRFMLGELSGGMTASAHAGAVMCVQHASGPRIKTATDKDDVQQLLAGLLN